jgi:hypothetical protein
MSIEVPLYRQEKDNTCALACLRMVLAAYGRHVQESELEAHVTLQPNGTPIEELERLARKVGLGAEIQEPKVEELRELLARDKLPIAYIDRAVFDLTPRQRKRHSIRDSIIHNVIPTQVTGKFVSFHDPRPPRITRKTIRLFRQAYDCLGCHCVVCWKTT